MEDFKIDIVLPWVDGSDKEWIKEKNKYLPKDNQVDIDVGANRYRDWDNVKFIFRGIEKFCPWVNKVFFITCGQKPDWLNVNNEKLVLIDHKDYIPQEYLPTFSSHPIELNMHRIKGLSEHFIYLNDDFFFIKKMKVKDFFVKGLPKLVAMEKPKTITQNIVFDTIIFNTFREALRKFDKKEVKKKHKLKWYNIKYPVETFFNMFYDGAARSGWAGFYMDHLPAPFLKSKIQKCWDMFNEKLDKVSKNKFRSAEDINQYLFTEYLLCTGNFYPDHVRKKGILINLDDGDINNNIETTCKMIIRQKYKTICLNDAKVNNLEQTKSKINNALEKIMPEKSSFEL